VALLRLDQVTKVFRGERGHADLFAVNALSLAAREGEFIAIVGPSGCGKSTTLNMIAGLEHPTSGGIYFDDAEVSRLPASRRNVGLVFQDYAIFPHMTIFDNLAFGLRVRKVPAAEVRERVGRMAEFLKLTASLDASPRVLSLSEIQRVAIGRTLLTRPAILLLDEPLSNLEASVRNELRVELKRLHMETGYTTIYVTHDQGEALALADRIAVMDRGTLQQFDTPRNVYLRPHNLFVAGFIGTPPMNLIECEAGASGGDGLTLSVKGAETAVRIRRPGSTGRDLTLGFRPEDAQLRAARPGEVEFKAKVTDVESLGPDLIVHLAIGSTPVRVVVPVSTEVSRESDISLALRESDLRLFDLASGTALADMPSAA
jgi:multiple sugar transport system ATP-binding protein